MKPTSGKWFVKVYAPWCPHCKNLIPTWKKLDEELEGKVNVAEIDATIETNLAKRLNVERLPTLFFFYDGANSTYEGSHSLYNLKGFALKTYKDSTGTIVPVMPISFYSIMTNLGIHLNDAFKNHPLIVAGIFVFMGIIMGTMIVALFFEVKNLHTYQNIMDEVPEENHLEHASDQEDDVNPNSSYEPKNKDV